MKNLGAICKAEASGRVGVCWLAFVSLLTCAVTIPATPAQAVGAPSFSSWLTCANNREGAEVVAHYMPPEPASSTSALAGTSVTFSGESNHALSFSIASSPALLSSPDVDSGLGSQQSRSGRTFYTFTSTRAAAVPRTIYWTASFTFTPEGCEVPYTFTTSVRELIVTPNEAQNFAARRQQEEEAAKKRLEEEGAAKKQEEAAATGRVVLNGVAVHVANGRTVAVKLTCSDVMTCVGQLTLASKVPSREGRGRHAKTESIGTASFSIPSGRGATVKVALNATGHVLMIHARRPVDATLTIRRTSPLPATTQTQGVRLVQQREPKAGSRK